MRSTKPLNRTFRYKAPAKRQRLVKEKHYAKYHTPKKPIRVHTKCPHCGKAIDITIK